MCVALFIATQLNYLWIGRVSIRHLVRTAVCILKNWHSLMTEWNTFKLLFQAYQLLLLKWIRSMAKRIFDFYDIAIEACTQLHSHWLTNFCFYFGKIQMGTLVILQGFSYWGELLFENACWINRRMHTHFWTVQNNGLTISRKVKLNAYLLYIYTHSRNSKFLSFTNCYFPEILWKS